MANSFFKFKQFMIHQDRCGMKVSTDAVVLGALSGEKIPNSVLDIGIGTGVISLMLAQRFPEAVIAGVELDKEAYLQACANANESTFKERITFTHETFQVLSKNTSVKYDLIISNPPYFPDHIKAKDIQRNTALHNDSLTFEDLANGVSSSLGKHGEFWLILPPRQMQDFQEIGLSLNLFPFRKIFLRDKQSSKVIRVIQAFSFENRNILESELHIKNQDGTFAKEYQELLKDFLIIF